MKLLGMLFGLFLLSGCTSVSTTPRPLDYHVEQNDVEKSDEALFSGDSLSLDDNDIERVLSRRVSFPKVSRVAVINLTTDDYWRYYSNDFVQLNDDIVENFIGKLKGSNRVYDASFMPSLLVPEKRTVPFLREAAARYQADLLLVYRTKCQSFTKYKFIDPNVARAYCSLEAVLIDTRTGVVPFTIVSTNQFTANRQTEDLNFNETIRKSELKAINAGLSEVATKLRAFIETTPTI